jgi:hypothetical protein
MLRPYLRKKEEKRCQEKGNKGGGWREAGDACVLWMAGMVATLFSRDIGEKHIPFPAAAWKLLIQSCCSHKERLLS